jgi:hypothetical protein
MILEKPRAVVAMMDVLSLHWPRKYSLVLVRD